MLMWVAKEDDKLSAEIRKGFLEEAAWKEGNYYKSPSTKWLEADEDIGSMNQEFMVANWV